MTRSIGKRGSTENLTTHMQVDKIDVDFGFMTNAGFVLFGDLGINSFGLGYDKEQITASETLFWVGVEVFLINFKCSGLKFSGRYPTTLRRQMVRCTNC